MAWLSACEPADDVIPPESPSASTPPAGQVQCEAHPDRPTCFGAGSGSQRRSHSHLLMGGRVLRVNTSDTDNGIGTVLGEPRRSRVSLRRRSTSKSQAPSSPRSGTMRSQSAGSGQPGRAQHLEPTRRSREGRDRGGTRLVSCHGSCSWVVAGRNPTAHGTPPGSRTVALPLHALVMNALLAQRGALTRRVAARCRGARRRPSLVG
jgi:hypothetical protein